MSTLSRKSQRKGKSEAAHEKRAAALFLAPNFLGFLVFTSLPVLAAIALSLTEWDPVAEPLNKIRFVGLSNFIYLLGFQRENGGWVANDPDFWMFTGNTLFMMMAIPVTLFCSLLLALALNQRLRGLTFLRAAFFTPSIAAGVGTMILWVWIYNPQYGLINSALASLGIVGPNWLQDYFWAKPALMLMGIVTAMGGTSMVVYLAALQDVPQELYEAAVMDGASPLARFRHVTIPVLKPVTFFLLVMGVIDGFQGGFDIAYVMTKGGPDGATTTLGYYVWSEAFRFFHMGYAAAIAVVMFALISLVALVLWRLGGDEARSSG